MVGHLILRLVIWFLLTSDFSVPNIVIGVSLAFLLPGSRRAIAPLKEWLEIFWKIIVAIPQAYLEALQMMLSPHRQEEVTLEHVKPHRTPGLVFLDIFLITFTPKTIVLKYHQNGWYEVHWVKERKSK